MDENLFQLVTVGLLGVTLLVLLVTLLTLNKLGKKLDEGSGHAEAQPHYQPAEGREPAEQESAAPSPAVQAAPSPAVAQASPAAEQAPARSTEADVAPAQAEPAATGTSPQTGTAPQTAAAATGFEDAPEEQPFEREGRWWFKRGDELLVYDEQSGQWEPAPAEATTPSRGPAPPAQAETGWSQPGTGQAAQPAEAAQGGFWKCPSCGAVNGSTATACRMCFTPKP
jgi:hypothetical protein